MNLILAIVQDNDADAVTQALLADNYRLTRLTTAGGFFRRGNATLLIGVEPGMTDDVLQIIQHTCCPDGEKPPADAGQPAYKATVFVLQADRFVHV